MYRLAEIEDIDQIAELRILQQKELFKKNYKIDDEKFYNNTKIFLLENLNKNSSLNEVQSYFKEMIKLRSFMNNKENISNIMLLLTEEVGELAKAIRKDATDLKIDSNKIRNYDSIESEIADVFIVLNSICTALDINLFDAIYNKERINVDRKWN